MPTKKRNAHSRPIMVTYNVELHISHRQIEQETNLTVYMQHYDVRRERG